MKLKHIFIILLNLFFLGCESDDNSRDNNPCLINKSVNVTFSGTAYADLIEFTGTNQFIRDDINFIKGVYIFNNGTDFFDAFELAEPNDCLSNCSTPSSLTEAKFKYTCGDETSSYNLDGSKVDGTEDDFSMRRYVARRSGNTLTISY